MLNVFPYLLIFTMLGPFVLRVAVGLMFAVSGYMRISSGRERRISEMAKRWKKSAKFLVWYASAAEIIVGTLLVTGFLTQAAALVGTVIALKLFLGRNLYKDTLGAVAYYPETTYILILVICVSLLFTGAGAFALDIPL